MPLVNATRVRSPTEAEVFSSNLCFQTGSGAHPASIQWVLGALSPRVKHSQGVMLTTHPLLVPRLRKSRSYTFSHPNVPLWSTMGPLYLILPCKCIKKLRAFTSLSVHDSKRKLLRTRVHTNFCIVLLLRTHPQNFYKLFRYTVYIKLEKKKTAYP
jgi:hypothetical protein